MSKINLSETVPNINCMPLLALMNPKIRLISYTSPLKIFYLQKTLLNVFPKHMNVQFPVQKCDLSLGAMLVSSYANFTKCLDQMIMR